MENLQYYYNKEEGIFFFSWEGETTPKDVLAIWNEIIESKAIPEGCRMILSDHSKIKLTERIENYFGINSIYEKYPKIFKHAKFAILVDTPLLTANLMVFNNRMKATQIKLFSTTEAAKRWLKEPRATTFRIDPYKNK